MKTKTTITIVVLIAITLGLIWVALNSPITGGKSDGVGTFKLNLGERYREDKLHFITFSGKTQEEYSITETTFLKSGYGGGPTSITYQVHIGTTLHLWGRQFLVTDLTDQYIIFEVTR